MDEQNVLTAGLNSLKRPVLVMFKEGIICIFTVMIVWQDTRIVVHTNIL